MKSLPLRCLLPLVIITLATSAHAQGLEDKPAKEIFGRLATPSVGAAEVIGAYAKGCISGAVALPADGPHWQAMRPSRNRAWGHPELVAFIEQLSEKAGREDGWPGLLVGDMAQARGGPMLTGHASHQSGLDADIWLTPMPDRRLSVKEREELSATLVVENGPYEVKRDVWTAAHFNLIKRAASHPRVDRVLVAAGIKKALCETETGNRDWLRTVRPFWGHNYHMHVRLKCPAGSPDCQPQAAKTPGDGCGKELDWWFTNEPWRPAKPDPDQKPKKVFPMTLAALPAQCRAIALSGGGSDGEAAPLPLARPAD